MQQIEIFEIPSPCIDVCESNSRGFCLGCYRSRDERFRWLKMNTAEKKKVIMLCQQRKKRHKQKLAASYNNFEVKESDQNSFDF
ncbi:DUF1289 domain-containing protein [Pseudoalteromonas sp. NBT06-2]|uniref:DUF1289 domain-containing protein n=1 Tax=Pseudoalteromonas sp. NBT06-2 TaxID=2025950 RepID=UPI000BA75A17|nr:DUF1289 domain-containing protein [Pseudoalteromonas sp. NBT06-2]PAJ75808.1 DUF1289 domain-containing protein [Pseudoalteromonas sp. NBT06-2]